MRQAVFCAKWRLKLYVCTHILQVSATGSTIQAVSCRLLTAVTRFLFWNIPHEICGGQSGSGTSFSPGPSASFPEFCSLSILILLDTVEWGVSLAWKPSTECCFGCQRALDRKVHSHECQSSTVKLCHDLFHRNFSFLLLLVTATFVFNSVSILFLESMALQRNEGRKKHSDCWDAF
jgi:hypothetical protein